MRQERLLATFDVFLGDTYLSLEYAHNSVANGTLGLGEDMG
jgi:hypothetical protein